VRDRKVRDTLLEAVGWIAARPHDFFDEFVRTRDRSRWLVHELRLNAIPSRLEACAVLVAEVAESKVLDAPSPGGEFTLGPSRAPQFLDGPVVLGTELSPQLGTAHPGSSTQRDSRHNHGSGQNNDPQQNGIGHDTCLRPSCMGDTHARSGPIARAEERARTSGKTLPTVLPRT